MAFSEKQRQIMRFPYTSYDALICDGAVRSGKTSIMSLSFFLWAMGNFNNCAFAFCGKSVGAVERNIVVPLLRWLCWCWQLYCFLWAEAGWKSAAKSRRPGRSCRRRPLRPWKWTA